MLLMFTTARLLLSATSQEIFDLLSYYSFSYLSFNDSNASLTIVFLTVVLKTL